MDNLQQPNDHALDALDEPLEIDESELDLVNGSSLLSAIGEFLSLVQPADPVFGTGGGFGGGGAGRSW
jgi:hypothetical protein